MSDHTNDAPIKALEPTKCQICDQTFPLYEMSKQYVHAGQPTRCKPCVNAKNRLRRQEFYGRNHETPTWRSKVKKT